jgi:hypothetical protein
MATNAYMSGRKKYSRPQAVLFADNPGTKINGFYVPDGYEVGAYTGSETNTGDFIILSDDNRSEMDFKPVRIEKRERMINGRMRSYHIADKLNISLSWDMLPSRAYDTVADFSINGNPDLEVTPTRTKPLEFTTDGGAGGVELLNWYENHKGSFWVYLSYDKYTNFEDTASTPDDERFKNINKYNEIIEVFFSDFNYSVVKRSGLNFDFWNVSLTLEEA